MMTSRVLLSRLIRLATAGMLAGGVLACGQEPAVAPRAISVRAAVAAKPPSNSLAVTSASPAFGDQATTIDVHVLGTGFTSGASATWLLRGVADPAHVRTNSTTFISSTELVANITIASDAQLAFWDVQVALAGGKNGVGSECFEVTSAQILGPGTIGGDAAVSAMNDQGQVVGLAGGSTQTAWVYDDAFGMVSLGTGQALGIDPLGAVVVGRDGNPVATAWLRQPDNSWLPQSLPRPVGSVGGGAQAATRTADGTLIAAGWDDIPGVRKSAGNVSRPVVWRLGTDGLWSTPQFYSIPSGFTSATASDVNRLEQVVGQMGTTAGVVWENPTTYAVLDGVSTHINPAGTLIVGGRNNGPALYWWRDPATHAWHTTGVPLPSLAGASCPGGLARDVNDAGVIVGWSCTPSGAKLPTVWLLDFSGAVPVLVGTPAQLPGLGSKSNAFPTAAAGVTETTPYVVSGTASTTGGVKLAVRWRLR